MAVYVDTFLFRRSPKGRAYGHMLADNPEELHAMAAAIGLRRHWYHLGSLPHYDVTSAQRQAALQRGACEVPREEMRALIRRLRRIVCSDPRRWGYRQHRDRKDRKP